MYFSTGIYVPLEDNQTGLFFHTCTNNVCRWRAQRQPVSVDTGPFRMVAAHRSNGQTAVLGVARSSAGLFEPQTDGATLRFAAIPLATDAAAAVADACTGVKHAGICNDLNAGSLSVACGTTLLSLVGGTPYRLASRSTLPAAMVHVSDWTWGCAALLRASSSALSLYSDLVAAAGPLPGSLPLPIAFPRLQSVDVFAASAYGRFVMADDTSRVLYVVAGDPFEPAGPAIEFDLNLALPGGERVAAAWIDDNPQTGFRP
jgi:hypothetical protein